MERDPSNPERVLIDGRPMRFSESVTEVLLEGGTLTELTGFTRRTLRIANILEA